MIFKDNDQIKIGFAEDANSTYMVFKEQLNEDDFIAYHQELLDELNTLKYTSGRHLVDTTHLKIVTPESRQWIAENIIPRIQQISKDNRVYIAVVLGCKAFTGFVMENNQFIHNEAIHIHYFSQFEDAKTWLMPERKYSYGISLIG